jgi:hypothetical protein
MMTIYHWILAGGFGIFIISGIYLLTRIVIKKGKADPASAVGYIKSAIAYSFTGAMSPLKKESAYLHLPTYTAGMIFHIGTFVSFAWLLILFFDLKLNAILGYISSLVILIAAICGIAILIKRITSAKLKSFSNPDDYFSNLLVTGFQIITALTILSIIGLPELLIYSTFLLAYVNIGKLRHSIYFFTSRIELGRFYGKRGVWPIKKRFLIK